MTHNCQHFAAEVIKILKAKRIHDIDKVRTKEKEKLPNCIIVIYGIMKNYQR